MNLKPFASAMIPILSILVGCSHEYPLQDPQIPESSKIHSMISGFYQKVHKASRAESDGFSIRDIETHHYVSSDSSKTRVEGDSVGEPFEMHTVTLDFGDTSGYAILSDTPGIDRIFYYTEEGCIGDTATIAPLKHMVETFPQLANIILNGEDRTDRSQDSGTRADLDIDPLVRFKWHQGWPFNFYATYCTCDNCRTRKNHKLAGCVTVALAQTIATVKIFRGSFYGNRSINFDALPGNTDCILIDSDTELTFGHFFQEIALNCQSKYGCEGTFSNLYAATNYMRDIGYLADHIRGGLDKERFITYLQLGLPHIMGGQSDTGGHCWILDGIKQNGTSGLYHVNWGWGPNKSNGWSNECYYYDYYDKYGDCITSIYHKNTEHLYIDRP